METASRTSRRTSPKPASVRYSRRDKDVTQVADKVGLQMPK